jgi:predicted Zn-dependent protease
MRRFFSLLVLCGHFSAALYGQQAQGTSGCTLPVPPFLSNKPNIFNEKQEQWLGDAQALQQEPDYDLLPDKDSTELDHIGQKLLAQLPPSPIHYRFHVYESEDANGFSIAGGYVYVSRKLITDARSEDEVAGVLAHEIGHIYTHQIAITYTRQFKSRMNISSVGNQEDLEDKLQLLLNVAPKDSAEESEDDREKDELLADRVGLYAMAKAGYAPKAFAENLDRITANKGRTGNILTDVLGEDCGNTARRLQTDGWKLFARVQRISGGGPRRDDSPCD